MGRGRDLDHRVLSSPAPSQTFLHVDQSRLSFVQAPSAGETECPKSSWITAALGLFLGLGVPPCSGYMSASGLLPAASELGLSSCVWAALSGLRAGSVQYQSLIDTRPNEMAAKVSSFHKERNSSDGERRRGWDGSQAVTRNLWD